MSWILWFFQENNIWRGIQINFQEICVMSESEGFEKAVCILQMTSHSQTRKTKLTVKSKSTKFHHCTASTDDDDPLRQIFSKMFGSPNYPVFPNSLLSDGDLFYSTQTLFRIWGLPRKRVWYVRGLLWKLVGNFGSRNYLKSNLLRVWATVGLTLFFVNQNRPYLDKHLSHCDVWQHAWADQAVARSAWVLSLKRLLVLVKLDRVLLRLCK